MGKSDKRLSLQINEDLEAIAKMCMRTNGYRSHSEHYASNIRHWALAQQPHSLTAEWTSLEPEERDDIDSALRKMVESGIGAKGSWLNKMIYDAIKELNGEHAKTPTVPQVRGRLPEVIRKALMKPGASDA